MVKQLKKGGSGVQPFMKKVDPICDGVQGGASACAIAKIENDNEIQNELIQSGGSDTVIVPSFEGAQNSSGEAYTANSASQQTNKSLLESQEQAKYDKVSPSEPPQMGGRKKKSRKNKKKITKKVKKSRKSKKNKKSYKSYKKSKKI